MTKQQFRIVFYTILGICILIIFLSFMSFDFIEVDTASDWIAKYFSLPIFIVTTPSCYLIYVRFLRQYESKEYKLKIWTQLRTIFRIVILTIAMNGIFFATTLSVIILTNAYISENKTILLNAIVVDYNTVSTRGRTRYYIKFQDQQINRIIDLKVQGPFQVGQTFNKTMKVGRWGLLYSEK